MKNNRLILRQVRKIWRKYSPEYYWGDPLDVRFYLCKKMAEVHNKKILDVGCNIGVILNCADDSNIGEGFDMDSNAIAIAKKINSDFHLRSKFYVQDVFKSKIKKNSFDVLILSNVLPSFDYGGYDFDDCKKFIDKCSGYIKKGGILYLTTPNGDNLYYKKKHKIRYNELQGLLKKNYDFDIAGWNPIPVQLGHILRYIPGWLLFLEFLMKKHFMEKRCVSFYVEAVKR